MISGGLFSRRCNPIAPNPLDTYIYFSLNEYLLGDISKIKYKIYKIHIKNQKSVIEFENRKWRMEFGK